MIYREQVEQADTLDQITEMDEALTGKEYEAIYTAALRKAQGWTFPDFPTTPQEVGA